MLAHHLDVLEAAGLIGRSRSSGDGRRRYVHLVRDAFAGLLPASHLDGEEILFICSQNSARSQLAAAIWERRAGVPASSAGTHPAAQVHPGAVAAARREGLDLSQARPRLLDDVEVPDLVVTVCDRAHEELPDHPDWLHWSIPDPVRDGNRAAFDAVVAELSERIGSVLGDERGAA